MKLTRKRNWMKCVVAGVLAFVLTFADALPAAVMTVQAAEATITSMAYYSPKDGPVLTGSGVNDASYGFVMPIFNGGSATWEDVLGDLGVKVKVNGVYTDIDSVSKYVYNSNWGLWNDSGFTGYWFKVSETTYLQLYSKTTGVTLDYTLEFTPIATTTISSMTATDGPVLTADATGSIGFCYPIFNGNPSIVYEAVAADLSLYVKAVNSSEWVSIDNNAASGWIYDHNFGQFYDGPGGYWFVLTESINVKLESKSSGASLIYTLNYEKANRTSNALSSYNGTTTYTADDNGAIGIPLPKIGGTEVYESDLGNFVYEIKINGNWVALSDYDASTFNYSGNGYNTISSKNQWGYWVDHIYGLWFQPVQQNYELRIGYPENGVKGGAINNNYVYYTFIGNPNAYRPEDFLLENIEIDETDKSSTSSNLLQLDGWTMIFNDEFNGTEINENYWTRETGYFSDPSNPDTWGWGNNELESYTDSEANSWVSDGALHLKAFKGDTDYEFDTNGDSITDRTVTSTYKSGKLVSRDKVKFTYGRVDFRAKLPAGAGLWPATWMMPNDDEYGTWARSGEIDVMEVRGRVTNESTGAIHFGDVWPNNRYASPSKYTFPEGTGVDDGYHTYSVIWEEDYIAWYVDGTFFQYVPSSTWYTVSSPTETAPFDQHFYLIMNLALGGWFDSEVKNEQINIESAEMLVDFVRVYQPQDEKNYVISEPSVPVAIEGLELNKTEVTLTEGESVTLSPVYTPVNTTDKGVTWTTSDVSIATVNNGKVTAVKEGTVTITATSTKNSGFKATATVTVKKAPEIESLSLSKAGLTLTEGDSTTLTVTYNPANTTQKDVTWESSNEAVAIVKNGKVTAVAEGEAVITVTSASNENISASCTVKVEKKQAEPVIPSTEYGVQKNGDGSLTFWVRAEANKIDNIFYYGKNKKNPVLSDLDGNALTAEAGNANYYTITIKDTFADTDTVSFMFGYWPIGSVGKADSAIMTLTYGDIPNAEAEEIPITGLALSETEITMKVGEQRELGVSFVPANTTQKNISWATSNSTIASFSSGVITAKAEGTVTVSVLSNDNSDVYATCTVKVEAADEPEIPSEEYGVVQNDDGTLTFWALAKKNTDAPIAFYKLNDTTETITGVPANIMTADASYGENGYSVTVSAEYADGDTLTYMIAYTPVGGTGRTDSPYTTITLSKESEAPVEVLVTGLTMSQSGATLIEGENIILSVSYTPENTTQTGVTWSTSDGEVATVVDGKVTAVGEGTATITATSTSNVNVKATCTITVLPVANPFGDVPENQWYYKYVMFAYKNDLVKGKEDDRFAPAETITRAEFVQILYNKENKPAVEFKDTFPDVKEGDWFWKAIIWANENGVASGTGTGEFSPNEEISREQIARILYNYATYKDYSTEGAADLTGFEDDENISTWAVNSMKWAVECGVMKGTGDNKLLPTGNAVRADATTMVVNFMKAFEDAEVK